VGRIAVELDGGCESGGGEQQRCECDLHVTFSVVFSGDLPEFEDRGRVVSRGAVGVNDALREGPAGIEDVVERREIRDIRGIPAFQAGTGDPDQLAAELERLIASPRAPVRTPTGRQLHDLLEDGLVGIQALEERPFAAPLPLPDDDVVPIEQLLYRGRGALRRATELRDEVRRSGAAPSADAVAELFDLLDLALAE
jgi:hypothetical protein